LNCKDWSFFGIWSKKNNAPFICLEPWFGIADPVNSDQQLISKKGIISLQPGLEFNCSYSLTFS
jgi:galactose mutarotase-like enzyme